MDSNKNVFSELKELNSKKEKQQKDYDKYLEEKNSIEVKIKINESR